MAELGSRRRTSRKSAAARSRSAFCRCANPALIRAMLLAGSAARIFSNWARPSSARPLLTSTNPRLLRASRLPGESVDSAAIGFDGGSGVSGALASEAELIPRLGGFWIECRGGSEVGKRGGKLRCRVERLAEVEAVVEGFGVERGGALQVGDRLRRIIGEPERDAEMILGGSELGVQLRGLARNG